MASGRLGYADTGAGNILGDNAVVVFLCLVVFALGLPGGTVFHDIDFVAVRGMYSMVGELDKNFFGKPYLVYMLNGIAYAAAFYLHKMAGNVQGAEDFRELYYLQDRILYQPIELEFHFLSHLIVLLFACIGVVSLYFIGRQLFGNRHYALLSALVLATSLYWVDHEHQAIVDLPYVALLIVLTQVCLALFRSDPARSQIWRVLAVGVAFGLATSAKYPAALLSLPIGLAIVAFRRDILRIVKDGAIIAVASLATFAILNPFIFLRLDHFLSSFARQAGEASQGKFGAEQANNFEFYTSAVIGNYGIIPLALALVGAGALAFRSNTSLAERLLILLSPAIVFLTFSLSSISFARYMLPVVPFLALLTCFGISWLADRFSNREAKLVTAGLIAGAVLVPNIHMAWSYLAHLYVQPTTEIMAKGLDQLSIDHDPEKIYASLYTRVYVLGRDYIKENEPPWFPDPDTDYEIVILDTWSHRGFITEWQNRPTDLPLEDADGRTVVQMTRKLTEVEPGWDVWRFPQDWRLSRFDRRQGPMIELYFKDRDLARQFARACNALAPVCGMLDGPDGYFARVVGSHSGAN